MFLPLYIYIYIKLFFRIWLICPPNFSGITNRPSLIPPRGRQDSLYSIYLLGEPELRDQWSAFLSFGFLVSKLVKIIWVLTWKNGNIEMETVKKESKQSGQKQETPAHLFIAFSPFHAPLLTLLPQGLHFHCKSRPMTPFPYPHNNPPFSIQPQRQKGRERDWKVDSMCHLGLRDFKHF